MGRKLNAVQLDKLWTDECRKFDSQRQKWWQRYGKSNEVKPYDWDFCYKYEVIKHVTGPPAPNSSKKYGPRIKDEENPHHTVTFDECSGTCKVECGLSVSQIWQL
ncbi:hypothetical protein TNCV_3131421 [Trichonephila clavipes]|nr:hypothetical protein TNCV_3131421 [Trichonephila clavipes]